MQRKKAAKKAPAKTVPRTVACKKCPALKAENKALKEQIVEMQVMIETMDKNVKRWKKRARGK